jgi:hypothetical protein
MEKGYIVINKNDGGRYVATDSSSVAWLIGVDRLTVWRWFKAGINKMEYKGWIIVKGYELVKSSRGMGCLR